MTRVGNRIFPHNTVKVTQALTTTQISSGLGWPSGSPRREPPPSTPCMKNIPVQGLGLGLRISNPTRAADMI